MRIAASTGRCCKPPNGAANRWSGRSIVVYSEQGLGDTIQFARFLPELARRGGKLTFLCHPNLMRLFKPLAADFEMVGSIDGGRRFDFQCALMSLPLRLDMPTPRAEQSYLSADSDLIAQWRERIGTQGLKVGLCWQGNPKGRIDEGRSIPLEKYLPLASVPGVRLISLQKTHGLEQLQQPAPGHDRRDARRFRYRGRCVCGHGGHHGVASIS